MGKQGMIYTQNASVSAQGLSLADVVEELRQQGKWLPAEQTWWFGWSELEITLPQPLTEAAALPTEWPVVHVFSPAMELRWLRRGAGRQAILLCEADEAAVPSLWQGVAASRYDVRQEKRILAGERLSIGGNAMRATVQLRRELDYGIDGAKQDQVLVADARAYYDAEARLKTVRYAMLEYQTPTVCESNKG